MASNNSMFNEEVAGSMGSMTATPAVFDGKKIRKPYTITKSRESWTEEEHNKFVDALRLFGRDWKRIKTFIGTKSSIQIRIHAQKYFLRVQEKGNGEYVPPPRPKRKSVSPYPQKASNIGLATAIQTTPLASQPATAFQVPSYLPKPEYIYGSDPFTGLTHNYSCPHAMYMQKENIMPPVGTMVDNCYGSTDTSPWPIFKTIIQRSHVPPVPENIMSHVGMMIDNCYGSTDNSTSPWPICKTSIQKSYVPPVPDKLAIAQVYNSIGSSFDPNSSGHLQKLKEMDPAVTGLVLRAMTNLSINRTSPSCEEHKNVGLL